MSLLSGVGAGENDVVAVSVEPACKSWTHHFELLEVLCLQLVSERAF